MGVDVYALRRPPKKERAVLTFLREAVSSEANQPALGEEIQLPALSTEEAILARLSLLAAAMTLSSARGTMRRGGQMPVARDSAVLGGPRTAVAPGRAPTQRDLELRQNLERTALRWPLRAVAAVSFRSVGIGPVKPRAMTRNSVEEPTENCGQSGLFTSVVELERG